MTRDKKSPQLINLENQWAYSKIARIYAGDVPTEDDPELRAKCRQAFASRLKGRDILEVGCGPGVDSHQLTKMGLNVTATDICDEFIEITRSRYPEIRAQVMDMTAPSFPPHSFDGIYSFASFIHLPRELAQKTLSGLFGLLRSPGVLFLSLIESDKVQEYVIPNWGEREDNPVLFTCYSHSEIQRELKTAGFVRTEIFSIPSSLYENLPRLVERGVKAYQIIAYRE